MFRVGGHYKTRYREMAVTRILPCDPICVSDKRGVASSGALRELSFLPIIFVSVSPKSKVRDVWHKNILAYGYGRNVRARITLRQQLRREPKVHEVENAIKDKNEFQTISVNDIARAYDRGDEVRSLPLYFLVAFLT
jgi:hypothetical protein